MPQMGYDMKEGTIVRWLKSEGAAVTLGEPIAEIETDKAVIEFESYANGVLTKIVVPAGSSVPVGQLIAIIGAEGEVVPDVPAPAQPSAEAAQGHAAVVAAAPVSRVRSEAPPAAPPPSGEAPASSDQVRVSPVARAIALERGVDLAQVQGTGPGGRIVKQDVLRFADEHPSAPAAVQVAATVPAPPRPGAPPAAAPAPRPAAPGEKVPLSRMRQQIARVTVRSKQQTPHFYVTAEIDMSRTMAMREQMNQDLAAEGVRVSVNDIVIKACVGALKKYPKFNAFYADDGIQMNERMNIGIAIAEEEGLIVPAILDCARKSLAEIAAATKDLVNRAKSGALHMEEYTGATFSISNLGMFDVTSFAAIIHPPQAGVLAVGSVAKRPVVRGDQVVVAQMMNATLSGDHRIVDGAEGALFLGEIKRLLENPFTLLT